MGRLYLDGKLAQVLPADDAEAHAAANPVQEDGSVLFDEAAMEAREDAIVRRMSATPGVKVLVLGGGHDLVDNVERVGDRKVELIVVESEG